MIKIDYSAIASNIMFDPKSFSLEKHGVEFRKGKTTADINKAIRLALKNGMLKTEYELSMLEVYIKDVFKARKAPVAKQ